MKTKWKAIGVTTMVLLALIATASVALAFTQSNFISFTLEACRNDGTITLPNGSGQFICPDAAYTTGNLGKGWNELDLVPHRLTTAAGTQSGVTTSYDVYIAADYQTNGKTGYDVISVPTVNAAKSDASCTVSAGAQSTQGSAGSPFGGGTDVVIYRDLTIHQNAGTTCVFDYYQRLALGSHLYSGSSLQSYMFEQAGLTGSKKTISIPVNQILPQSLSKTMSASQSQDYAWNVVKQPSPATLTFGNSCDANQPKSQGVQIQVTWTRLAATPSAITVITNVYATNPAARTITTAATDVIYSGNTQLDTASGSADVPANTTNFLLLTHTVTVPAGTINLNDIATATYTDKITGIAVPGNTTATASATPQITSTTNASATINDVESMTGSGLTFSTDSFTPAIGAFDNGYVAGTATTGPVSWTSSSQPGNGSVTFNKTVYVAGPSQATGDLHDVATLTGSSGFTTSASADVNVSVDARVSLTINKTITAAPGFTTQTFTFHVLNSSNVEVATPTLTFNAGDTNKSVTVGNLAPGSYTVSEDAVTGWVMDSNKSATINLPTCSGSVSFSNVQVFSPSLSTTPNPTSATVGAVLNDSATLSGGNNPTGNIVFNLYGPNDVTCAGPAVLSQTVPVSGSGASTSPGFTSNAAGAYRWTAHYSGDTYNNPADSGCQAEQVTVGKATPTLTTNASGPIPVGLDIHDVATLSGGFNLTGSISFNVFAPGDTSCSTPISVPPAQTVNGAGDYTSGNYTTAAVGTYRWIAHYSGDANNNAVDTKCNDANESSTTVKAGPALTTSAFGPVTVGQAIHDVAHLSGGFNPTGSIAFDVFAPNDTSCSTPISVPPAQTVNGAGDYTSGNYTTTAVGNYRWIAHYSGDVNNNAVDTACNDSSEVSTVNKVNPSISTTPSVGGAIGSVSFTDTATLSGTFGSVSGETVTFQLFSPADPSCSGGQPVFQVTGTLNASGSATTSQSFTPSQLGTYHWIASYPGDANNSAATSGCHDEPVTVTPASPSINTVAGGTVVIGSGAKLTDTAVLSGGFNPLGTITFTLYDPAHAAVYTDIVTVNGNGTYDTSTGTNPGGYLPTVTGTYTWSATYSGDSYNTGVTDNGQNESEAVSKASPALTTTASGPAFVSFNIHDVAHLSGGDNPTGSITFDVFAPGDTTCSTPINVPPAQTVNGNGDYTSGDYTAMTAGTYRWIANYSGDASNNPANTACNDANESSVVKKANPAITTQASPTSGTVGQTLTVGDTATITGGFNPTGSITFNLYNNSGCSGSPVISGTGTISNGTASFSTAWTPPAAGTYYWQASYAGDGNNNGFTAPCVDANEQIVIAKLTPAISTSATNASGASTSVSDSATLSGGYNPTGSITFKLYGPSPTASCSGNLVFTSSAVAVNGNGAYGPVSFSPAAPGTYYWIASYSGDANNIGVTGACGGTGETSNVPPGFAKVVKTVSGAAPSGTQTFTFTLRQGASVSSLGTILETQIASSTNAGVLNFTTQLLPGQHYQMCEDVMPGWNSNLGPNLFVPNSIIPPALPNPNVNNMTICTDFVAQAGQLVSFTVDNTPPPGGRALTIGFWKNWASCTTSSTNKKPVLDQTLATATSITTNPPGGLVVAAQNPGGGWPNFATLYYLVLKGSTTTPNVAPGCSAAVNLLNKTTINGKTKMASDPLFNMAAQLVGAELNYFAGAGKNGTTTINIQRAVLLLGKYVFNGNTYSPKLSSADAATANCLANQLNNYNNDFSVSTCP